MHQQSAMTRDTDVLVLGAYGMVGRAVAAQLCNAGTYSVVAAGRRRDALENAVAQLAGSCEQLVLDVNDDRSLRNACQRARVVVNCVGPYLANGANVVSAAIDGGCAYVDVASEQEHFRRLQSLNPRAEQAGILVVTGAGAYPGLSGLLLTRLLADVGAPIEAETVAAMGRTPSPDVGVAEILTAIWELGYELEVKARGKLKLFEPKGETIRRTLPPPFGTIDIPIWPQLEVLAWESDLRVTDLISGAWIAGMPSAPSALLRLLRWADPASRAWLHPWLRRWAAWAHRRGYASKAAAKLGTACVLAASARGANGQRASRALVVDDIAGASSWLAVLITERILAGSVDRSGVVIPADLVKLSDVIPWLRVRGCAMTEWTLSANGQWIES